MIGGWALVGCDWVAVSSFEILLDVQYKLVSYALVAPVYRALFRRPQCDCLLVYGDKLSFDALQLGERDVP